MIRTALWILRGSEGIAAMLYEHVIRPALFCLDAETAHHLTMSMMSAAQALGFGRAFLNSVPQEEQPVAGDTQTGAGHAAQDHSQQEQGLFEPAVG